MVFAFTQLSLALSLYRCPSDSSMYCVYASVEVLCVYIHTYDICIFFRALCVLAHDGEGPQGHRMPYIYSSFIAKEPLIRG